MPLEADRAARGIQATTLPSPRCRPAQCRSSSQQAIGVRLGVVSRLVAAPGCCGRPGAVAPDENRTYPIVAAVERLDPQRRERRDGRRREEGPGARVVLRARRPSSRGAAVVSRPVSRCSIAWRARNAVRSHDWRRARRGDRAARRRAAEPGRLQLARSGRWASAASSCTTSAWSRRWTASCSSAASTPGLRFDRGFEFYRIADLNRVWILADVYRDQLPFIRRGASARITTAEAATRCRRR